MSLRDKLKQQGGRASSAAFDRFGVLTNPFPSSSQTSGNPHLRLPVDEQIDARIVTFLSDRRTEVVVLEGTQGVGKTNLLNFYELELQEVLAEQEGYYVVRYLADPEASFEGTIRRLFQELGADHLMKLAARLRDDEEPIEAARSHDMRAALRRLAGPEGNERVPLMLEWLLGFRLLKSHREELQVQFRLDTVESKTAALRDLVVVSNQAEILEGIFLLLDELEKQDGVLGPTGIVRYLSAVRAIIDALPRHLFMMIAVTPDAMRRYSSALPAFRSRLQNQIKLAPLENAQEATALAGFYLEEARDAARRAQKKAGGEQPLMSKRKMEQLFEHLLKVAERRGDQGVRHREFLNDLHAEAEKTLQQAGSV